MIKDIVFNLQKQPLRDVLTKRCSENMQQIYRRTPMPSRTSAWVFPVNLLHIFRTPYPKSASGWLLLNLLNYVRTVRIY